MIKRFCCFLFVVCISCKICASTTNGIIYDISGATKAPIQYNSCDLWVWDGLTETMTVSIYMPNSYMSYYCGEYNEYVGNTCYENYYLYCNNHSIAYSGGILGNYFFNDIYYQYRHTISLPSTQLTNQYNEIVYRAAHGSIISQTPSIYLCTLASLNKDTIFFDANGGKIPITGQMGTTQEGYITGLSSNRESGYIVVTQYTKKIRNFEQDCPTREGEVFTGWYTSADSGEQVIDSKGKCVVGTYWNTDSCWIGTSNLQLFAHWETLRCAVSTTAVNGSIIGGGIFDYKSTITLTATPSKYYHFVRWTDGSIDNPRTTSVLQDETYTAIFELDTNVYYDSIMIQTEQPCYSTRKSFCPEIPPSNEIWYTSLSRNAVPLNKNKSQLVSNVYQNGKGIYKFSNNVTNIANELFANNDYSSITLPSSVTSIESYGFEHCKQCTTIIMSENISSFSVDVFDRLGENATDTVRIYFMGRSPSMQSTSIWNLWKPTIMYYPANKDFSSFMNTAKNANGTSPKFVSVDYCKLDTVIDTCATYYTIKIMAINGSISGSGQYESGDSITLIATPNTGFEFLRWSDGLTNNPRFVTITQDSTFIAEFVSYEVQEMVNVTLINESPHGSMSSTSEVAKNSTITLQATAPDCSKFVKWSDNDTSNPRQVLVTKDSTFIAEFEQIYYGIVVDTRDSVKGDVEMKVENEHEYADLGLSVKWATCNIGATKPEEYGDYFAWGETSPQTDYVWVTYKHCNDNYNSITKYCVNSNYGTVDGKISLEKEDDAACVNWGKNWRLPTYIEMEELVNNCSATWTNDYNGTGVAGRIFTSKKLGYTNKSIFLPAAGYKYDIYLDKVGKYGYYWTSSLYESYSHRALIWYFCSDYVSSNYFFRYFGQSIRPVCP